MPPSAPASAPAAAPSSETTAAARCPRCEGSFPVGAESCPKCSFNLAAARRAFPFTAPPLEVLVDPLGMLPADRRQVLREPYQELRHGFPQVHWTLALLNLAPGTNPREFAFWWFNEAPAANADRAWHVLLLFDAQSQALCLTPGRAIEPFLHPENWNGALTKVAAAAAEADWITGLHTFLKIAPILLEADWQRAQPLPPRP